MPSITGVDAKQSDATDADWPSKETDVGFHLIADSLEAPIVKLNVVPGNGKPIGEDVPSLNSGSVLTIAQKKIRGVFDESSMGRFDRHLDTYRAERTAGGGGH